MGESNGYSVHAANALGGWEVRIMRPDGSLSWTRHCADEAEARMLTSTVQQHIYWLSAPKFEEYYRLHPWGTPEGLADG
jgi:hypothetical protein